MEVSKNILYFVFYISNTMIDNQSYYLNYKIQKTFNFKYEICNTFIGSAKILYKI